jgi:hypothetical protein
VARVSRTKPYDTNITPIVAIRKASGTARPIRPATAVPLSAIAAVGAMIASDSAITSMKRSSLRSPCGCSMPRAKLLLSPGPGDASRVARTYGRRVTAIGVDPEFGAGRLFLADARLALGVLNHVRYQALERTLGISRQQANVVTFVLVLTAADLAHNVAQRLPHPHLPAPEDAALGMLGLSNAVHGIAGAASRDIPHFKSLLALAMLGGLAAPGIRAFRRARATEHRVRTARIRRYVEAQRARA